MPFLLERTPITEPLDAFLLSVVQTLHSAVSQGITAAAEAPLEADRRIVDCAEILDEIMAGRVEEWVGPE